jgi:hypothetical protein
LKGTSRPTLSTSRRPAPFRAAGGENTSGSIPQWITRSFPQCSSGTCAISWLRAKSLMQTTKSALSTFARRLKRETS